MSTSVTTTPSSNVEEGRRIAKSYAGWAAGAGLIPVPLLDVAGITGVQIAMIHKIADLYKVPHAGDRVKTIVLSLVGGVGSYGIATSSLGSLVKAVPFVGSLLGIALMPSLAVAATIGLGEVFILHFESGGTLLDFDTEKMAAKFHAATAEAASTSGAASPSVPVPPADASASSRGAAAAARAT
jgi:uncharacterized protein (DUF697 family)